jgi:exopolyphosphatase/guanosine-5'-triphosphate,3'-diphosphate pyrophosphatase
VPPASPSTPASFDNSNGQAYGEVRKPAYAALDLGTNNCRLLVARPSRRGFKVIDAFSRIIRLGEGVTASGRLSEVAIDRTIEALQVCATKIRRHRVERMGLIATEACRLAANAPQFLERARTETGLDIRVVNRETEAKLAVCGCASLIDFACEFALVFDIGGGSSELIWLDLSRRKNLWQHSLSERLEVQGCIAAWTSLPVGVVTLAERYGGRHVDHALFEDMVAHVGDLLAPFEAEHRLRQRLDRGNTHLLGTSGCRATSAPGSTAAGWRSARCGPSPMACSTPPTRSAWPSRASAASGPTWCSQAAPSSRRCSGLGHASACAWPTGACARASWRR